MLTKLQEIRLLVLLFHVLLDFMISIISSISSLEIYKVNSFPAPAASFQLIFRLNLFIAFEFEWLTKPRKLSFGKGKQ